MDKKQELQRVQTLIDSLIDAGVVARENQLYDSAKSVFKLVAKIANENKLYDVEVNADMQIFLVYNLAWKTVKSATRKKAAMQRMHEVIREAFDKIKKYGLSGQPKALAFMRYGQYEFERQEYVLAVINFRAAVKELKRTDNPNNPEYLGHLGLALVYSGDKSGGSLQEGFDFLRQANQLVSKAPFGYEWNRLIAKAGICMRLADAHSLIGERKPAEQHMQTAKVLAESLAAEGMPQRISDWSALRKVIDKRFSQTSKTL